MYLIRVKDHFIYKWSFYNTEQYRSYSDVYHVIYRNGLYNLDCMIAFELVRGFQNKKILHAQFVGVLNSFLYIHTYIHMYIG